MNPFATQGAGALPPEKPQGTAERHGLKLVPASHGLGALYGTSAPMREVYQMIDKVAPTDLTVLVVGESGSGKELVAQTIHRMSDRAGKPFIAVNCGAIAPTLIEAELFGHEKGAFTGAMRSHRGFFERAAGGTLFLDEITEMAPEMQVRLLRVLDSGTFTRVGGDTEIVSSARIIAATNRDPVRAVEEGKLREDLMYRLAVFPVHLPPLRVRGEDIELLARQFLEELNEQSGAAKRFSDAALANLRAHSWPGNVRELKSCVHRAYVLADEVVDGDPASALPRPQKRDGKHQDSAGKCLRFPVGTPLNEMERDTIFATLEECSGDKRRAAEMLGVSLKTLYNRLHQYAAGGAG
jgi:DNA-binding NtrC family response regulator